MYFNFALNLYLSLSSADNPLQTIWTKIRLDILSKALSGYRLFDTLKVMTS